MDNPLHLTGAGDFFTADRLLPNLTVLTI